MKTAIAVFCKTPGLSPLKTRLAGDIGTADAEAFYRMSLAAVEEVLLRTISEYRPGADIYWAAAEREAVGYYQSRAFQCLWTGSGALGERISRIYQQLILSHDQVLIIGSDSPQFTPEYLIKAIGTLTKPDCDGVVGPCRDGGFVLFGGKKAIPKPVWTQVKYSGKDTLQMLLTQLEKIDFRYEKISEMGDVDQYDDLIALLHDFRQMGSKILPAQLSLYFWIRKLSLKRYPDRLLYR